MGRRIKNDDTTPPVTQSATSNETTELTEFLTQKGAMALAKRVEHYWHTKGYQAARCWAEPIGERFEKVGTYEIYRVTSNLVNGLPPRYAPRMAQH
jgi:hypothetical protein